eukprot:2880658-Pleurochrysis_carterae.AAC.1
MDQCASRIDHRLVHTIHANEEQQTQAAFVSWTVHTCTTVGPRESVRGPWAYMNPWAFCMDQCASRMDHQLVHTIHANEEQQTQAACVSWTVHTCTTVGPRESVHGPWAYINRWAFCMDQCASRMDHPSRSHHPCKQMKSKKLRRPLYRRPLTHAEQSNLTAREIRAWACLIFDTMHANEAANLVYRRIVNRSYEQNCLACAGVYA